MSFEREPHGLQQVRTLAVVRSSWRVFWASAPRLAPYWLAWSVVEAVLLWAQRGVGRSAAATSGLVTLYVLPLVAAFGFAVLGALCLRILLDSRPAARLDRGFFEYVVTLTVIGLLGSLLVAVAMQAPSRIFGPAASAHWATQLALFLLAWSLVRWFSARVLLWPISRLLGNRRLTVGFAWSAMARPALPVVAAGLLLGGLPELLAVMAQAYFYYYALPWALLVFVGGAGWATAISITLAAVVYRMRLGEDVAALADVFD